MNTKTAFDLIFRNARTRSSATPVDIGVAGGRIAAIEPRLACEAAEIDVGGRLALPGFVDTHIHLDKACLLGRCGHDHGSVAEAIAAVAAMKRDFTVEDVYARGAKVIERAIVHGTTRMRTHVEIDPRIGLRGFEAIKALKRDYAWAIDLSICVFPQEGLTNDPGAEELLIAALRDGGEAIGGCPYMDTDPNAHLEKIFDLAQEFDVDIDLHLDFDLDPSWWHLDEVCRQTERRNYQGRVAIGHATKLSALPPDRLKAATARLAKAGVAVTVLPATDLYLMGRDATHNAPRGLTVAHKLVENGVAVFGRHQQRAQSLHAVRRRLAAADGEFLRQCRACRHQRIRRLPRSRHRAAGAADEPAGLRHRAGQSRRPHRPRHRQRRERDCRTARHADGIQERAAGVRAAEADAVSAAGIARLRHARA